jgi:hypothetical protein
LSDAEGQHRAATPKYHVWVRARADPRALRTASDHSFAATPMTMATSNNTNSVPTPSKEPDSTVPAATASSETATLTKYSYVSISMPTTTRTAAPASSELDRYRGVVMVPALVKLPRPRVPTEAEHALLLPGLTDLNWCR